MLELVLRGSKWMSEYSLKLGAAENCECAEWLLVSRWQTPRTPDNAIVLLIVS
jgi:hypothetical protein